MGDLDFDFIPMFNSVVSEDDGSDSRRIGEARIATVGKRNADELPPWLVDKDRLELVYEQKDFTLGLHEEILDYVNFISPSEKERKIREELIDRVKAIAYKVFPLCEIDVFGSFQTGLYLSTSDVDLVVQLKNRIPHYLRILADEIERSKMATQVEAIDSARVPIVKFLDKKTNITVDICFNNSTSVEAFPLITERIEGLPALKPLIMVLKHFLYCRRLNETYYGGIGSFVLLLMVSNFLKTFALQFKEQRSTLRLTSEEFMSKCNLGILLISFFQLYGVDFNYAVTGICEHKGRYFRKVRNGFLNPSRAHLLSVESPYDHRLDIGSNSYNIMKVRAAFCWAYKELTFTDTKTGAATLLSRILPIESFSRNIVETTALQENDSSSRDSKQKRNDRGLKTHKHRLDRSSDDFEQPRTKKMKYKR